MGKNGKLCGILLAGSFPSFKTDLAELLITYTICQSKIRTTDVLNHQRWHGSSFPCDPLEVYAISTTVCGGSMLAL